MGAADRGGRLIDARKETTRQTRAHGLVFIESDDPRIGMVCVIPVGITEISSVTIEVRSGHWVSKGRSGGSTNPKNPAAIEVNAEIAIAN